MMILRTGRVVDFPEETVECLLVPQRQPYRQVQMVGARKIARRLQAGRHRRHMTAH